MVQLQTDIINLQKNQFNGVLLFLYMAANFILYISSGITFLLILFKKMPHNGNLPVWLIRIIGKLCSSKTYLKNKVIFEFQT